MSSRSGLCGLLPPPSPLPGTLSAATRLWPGHSPLATAHPDILRGRRGLKKPFLALTAKQDLGNCRHALSQVVVAGIMVVDAPVFPGLSNAPRTPTPTGPVRVPAAPAPRNEPDPDVIVLTFTPPEI